MVNEGFSITRPTDGSVRGPMAFATAWLGAAWVAGYLFLIARQGTEMDTPMTVFLATFVAVMAALAFGAAIIKDRNERGAQGMLYAATGGFLPAGVLGLASIGLPLILVGLLALVSAGSRQIPLRFVVAAHALSAIPFVIGVALTIRVS